MKPEPRTLKEHYNQYRSNFRKDSLEDLITTFNREVGNKGWAGIRGAYLDALCEEILERGIDGGGIITESGASLGSQVKPKLCKETE